MTTEKVIYQKASLFRRICAFFFDVIIMLSCYVFFNYVVITPIINNFTVYKEEYKEYTDRLTSTNLFLYHIETDTVKVISSKYDECLTKFYNNNELNYTIDDYNKLKYEHSDKVDPENNIFKYIDNKTYEEEIYKTNSDGSYILSADNLKIEDSNKVSNLNKFYSELVNKLANEIYEIEDISNMSYHLGAIETMRLALSFVPSVIIAFLLFPLIFKDGATLGKKVLQMRVITVDGYKPSNLIIFARFIYLVLIELVFSLTTYGIAIVISFVIVCVSKNHQAIHDLIARTIVIRSINKDDVSDKDILTFEVKDGK